MHIMLKSPYQTYEYEKQLICLTERKETATVIN